MSASSKKKLRKEQESAKLTERQLQEQKEAKKLRGYTIGFTAAIIAIVVVALLTLGFTAFMNSGILERNTDSVKIGDHVLTAAQFNYYFIDEFQNTYSEWEQLYGDSADMYIAWEERYDITKPLNEQKHPNVEGRTYADYFAELALDTAKETYALYDAAQAAGFTLSQEEQDEIDSTIKNMETWGMLYGYSDLKGYLKGMYGNGATEESFREYLTVMTVASCYEESYTESLSYEQNEIDAYNAEHFNDFSSFDYSSFVMLPDDFMEHDEEGTHEHTDEDNAAALEAAKSAAESIVASGANTYEALNEAIAGIEIYAEKTATQNKDILYTGISPKIGEWLAAEERTEGELGLIPYTSTSTDEDGNDVEKTVGYYVILFEGRNDNEQKLVNVRHLIVEFEGGTEDENGTKIFSDDEKAAAKQKVEELYNVYKDSGSNEDAFKSIVSEDANTGNYTDADYFENMYPGQKISSDEFNDWCFAADREAGDCEIVETEFGYHIIFFVSHGEQTYRDHMIEEELAEAEHEAWHKGLVEAVNASIIDISKLSIDITMA